MSILSGKYRIKQKYLYLLERQWYREQMPVWKVKIWIPIYSMGAS